MANIKSAKKRINVINRQKKENSFAKATIATYIKKYRALLASKDFANAEAKLKETISLIDSAESKGVLHKNNASRKVARLNLALTKAKGANNVEEKVVAKKAPKEKEVKEVVAEVKKPAAKKTSVKAEAKPVEAKKAPAKAEAKTAPAKKAAAKTEQPKKAETTKAAKPAAAKKTTAKKA